jgi:hypothetical protein
VNGYRHGEVLSFLALWQNERNGRQVVGQECANGKFLLVLSFQKEEMLLRESSLFMFTGFSVEW